MLGVSGGLSDINDHDVDLNSTVRLLFAEGFGRQMRVLVGFTAVQFLAVAMLWRRTQVRVVTKKSQ